MLGRTRNRPRSLTLTYASLPLLAFAAALLPAVVANAHAHQRRDFRPLSDAQVRAVAELDPPPWDAVDSGHMGKLLVERVAGTKNLTEVQKYISGVFGKLGWHEEQVEHTEKTPIGDVRFNNLIYTFDPAAPRRLVLSAHIDSKWFPEGGFIGATDSAAPCGTMIDVAEALTPLLSGRAERLKAGKPVLTADVDEHEAAETTLQIVFFDGEEAFHQWSATDSVYGSRHLAQVWDETYLPDDHALARRRMAPRPTVLDTIDVLVLLDLMGTPKPRFYSYFRETDWMFDELAAADKRLRTARLVKGTDTWFNPQRANPAGIEDDHIPFLHRGVDCLHLIPSPFPSVWHRMSDNKDALDLNTLRRWNTIMRVWTAGYLHLAPDDPPADADRAQDRRDELVRE